MLELSIGRALPVGAFVFGWDFGDVPQEQLMDQRRSDLAAGGGGGWVETSK